MLIAIDFDGTIKRSSCNDPQEIEMWLKVVNAFRSNGHDCFICTMRSEHCGLDDIDRYADALGMEIVYCDMQGTKRKVCKDKGLSVDLWIDDMPDMI